MGLVLSCSVLHSEVLTLDSCLRAAQEHNADIAASRLEVEKAQEVKAAMFSKYFPQVSTHAISYHALNPLISFGINDIQSDDARRILQALYDLVKDGTDLSDQISLMRYGVGVGALAVQPIYMGGRIVNANKLAKVGIEAAELQAEVSERDVLENVESTYFLVLGLQEKEKTMTSALQLLDSLQKTVDVALKAGLVTQSDALQIALKKNELQAKQLQLNNGIVLASQLLCLQIGIEQFDSLSLESLNEPKESVSPFTRPEIRLLGLQVEAEQLRKKITLGEALPQVTLGGAYYWGNIIKDDYNHNGLLFATASIPLTQWWETSHKLRAHNIAIRQYELQRSDLSKKMSLEAQQAYNQMIEAQALLLSDSSALQMAEENYRIATLNYKAGINTLNDVLQANMLLLEAQNAITDRRISYLVARRRLMDIGGL